MPLDFKKPCKFTLSANEINQFNQCHRKRYYASRDCLALRTAKTKPTFKLGDSFHKALAYYYTELEASVKLYGSVPEVDIIADMLDDLKPYELGVDENGECILDADNLKMFNCMINIYKEQIPYDVHDYEVLECEKAFYMENWPINDVMYHGYIDMVVRKRSDGKIYFFEHKTVKNFWPEIYARLNTQVHIYDAYGVSAHGDNFGGMILNEIKKAKTEVGYDTKRILYDITAEERKDFFNWLAAKTRSLTGASNLSEPCNDYMSCNGCEYAPICLKFGYELPTNTQEVIDSMKDADGNNLYMYDPRIETDGEGE